MSRRNFPAQSNIEATGGYAYTEMVGAKSSLLRGCGLTWLSLANCYMDRSKTVKSYDITISDHIWLVVWNMTFIYVYIFHILGIIIIPFDELHHFSEG